MSRNPKKRPNVIIILTDDQGFGDLGCHGNPLARTPHLDRLHAESVRLTDFHVAPMCTPTRGQLLTGLDAARNGALNVSGGRALLRADLPTMADIFREGGYRTGLFGKWHLGDSYPYRPQDRGFEESLWFPSSHINSLPDYWENDYFDDVYCRNGERHRYHGYCNDVFFREAMDWMERRAEAEDSFFAFLPTNVPHAPLWVPEEDRRIIECSFSKKAELLAHLKPAERENILRFLVMIWNMDTQVGRLRRFLQDRNLANNTLLIFLTDNGSTFGPLYFNAGMRGGKRSLWEGGHRVPCFFHWPNGNLGSPRDVAGLTQAQDLLPTLLEFCGLAAPAITFDGESLAPALRDISPVPEDRALVVNYSRQHSRQAWGPSWAEADYPIPDTPAALRPEGAAVLWRHWRLLEAKELYDLRADPEQTTDVSDRYPEVTEHLLEILDQWWNKVEKESSAIQRLIIGHEAENPVLLTACEWRDVFLDQQNQLRLGEHKNSFWHLEVAQSGIYQFALRHWPEESGLTLGEGCPPTKVADGILREGRALPIAHARIFINGQWHAQDTAPDDTEAVFEVPLSIGPVNLYTWFDDASYRPLCGVYHVMARRIAANAPHPS